MLAGPPLATLSLAWGAEGEAPPVDLGPSDLRGAIRKLLRDDPAVFAIVGGKIRYARSNQRDREPRITFLVPSRLFGRDLDGPDDTSEARVRVSAWADDSNGADALAEAVRMALDGFQGWVGAVYIASIDHEVSVDLPEWEGVGDEAVVYQIAIDFMVDHRVTYPNRGG